MPLPFGLGGLTGLTVWQVGWEDVDLASGIDHSIDNPRYPLLGCSIDACGSSEDCTFRALVPARQIPNLTALAKSGCSHDYAAEVTSKELHGLIRNPHEMLTVTTG